MPIIRIAETTDARLFWEHLCRHGQESGRENDIIFSPFDEKWDVPFEVFEKSCREKWARSVSDVGWERSWIIADSNGVYGEITLAQQPPLNSCLHRATLMMGIERSHRSQGYGYKLVEQGIAWAKSQPSLEWIQLKVFENNEPARNLYKKFGFRENGTTPDMFRVFGKQIADISMLLKLK